MTGNDRLVQYLRHMFEAADQAIHHVDGMDMAAWLADKRTQQAVILNIIVIGEVAAKLLQNFESFLDRHPELPWRNMKGMRNRIAHGYFDIDLNIVWDTIQTELPRLLASLPAVIDDAKAI